MPLQMIDRKEEWARDIALCLLDSKDTDVTVEMIRGWHKWDVYEWIEAFGYCWDDESKEWYLDDEAD